MPRSICALSCADAPVVVIDQTAMPITAVTTRFIVMSPCLLGNPEEF
jgi:hypothetical protein